jgi:hypothetical protein
MGTGSTEHRPDGLRPRTPDRAMGGRAAGRYSLGIAGSPAGGRQTARTLAAVSCFTLAFRRTAYGQPVRSQYETFQGRPVMKTLFALVLLFDMMALSGASQIFILKPIKSTGVQLAQSFPSDNRTFPELLDFGARDHFGL